MVYVYVIQVDGVTRYIGKGQGWRLKGHLAVMATRPPRERIHHLMLEARAGGAVVTGHKVAEGLTEHQAREMEARLVREGVGLWNIAPGGGGCSSAMASKGWACPIKRESRTSAMNTEEARAAKSAASKARWQDPAYREKISAARKRTWEAGGYASRKGIGFAHINASPDAVAKMSATRATQSRTPEAREAMRLKSRALWDNPEKRAAVLAARRAKAQARKGVA